MLPVRSLLRLMLCGLALGLTGPALAADDAPAPADPWADVEDPRRFETLAEAALAEGRTDEARDLFDRMLQDRKSVV